MENDTAYPEINYIIFNYLAIIVPFNLSDGFRLLILIIIVPIVQ